MWFFCYIYQKNAAKKIHLKNVQNIICCSVLQFGMFNEKNLICFLPWSIHNMVSLTSNNQEIIIKFCLNDFILLNQSNVKCNLAVYPKLSKLNPS